MRTDTPSCITPSDPNTCSLKKICFFSRDSEDTSVTEARHAERTTLYAPSVLGELPSVSTSSTLLNRDGFDARSLPWKVRMPPSGARC